MALLDAQLALDALDDHNAIFRGLDSQDIPVTGPFGSGMMTAQYPALCIARSAWEDMGAPTVLSLSLDRVTIPES